MFFLLSNKFSSTGFSIVRSLIGDSSSNGSLIIFGGGDFSLVFEPFLSFYFDISFLLLPNLLGFAGI